MHFSGSFPVRDARAGLRVRAATRPAFPHPLTSRAGPSRVEVHVIAASRGVSSATTCTSWALSLCGMRAPGCEYVLQLAPLSRIHSRLASVCLASRCTLLRAPAACRAQLRALRGLFPCAGCARRAASTCRNSPRFPASTHPSRRSASRRGARSCGRLRRVERTYVHLGGGHVRDARAGLRVRVATRPAFPHPLTSRVGPGGVEVHVVAGSCGVSSAPTCTSRPGICGMRAPSAGGRAGGATRPRRREGPRPPGRRAATPTG